MGTRFQKGQSGNPSGRPPGAKNKSLSAQGMKDYLGKRTQAAIDTIFDIMQDDEATDSSRFKAALAIVAADKDSRKELRDEIKHQMEMKKAEIELKKLRDENKPDTEKPKNNGNAGSKVLDLKSFGKR